MGPYATLVGKWVLFSHQCVSGFLCHIGVLMGPYVTSVDPYVTSVGKWFLMPFQWVNGSLSHISG